MPNFGPSDIGSPFAHQKSSDGHNNDRVPISACSLNKLTLAHYAVVRDIAGWRSPINACLGISISRAIAKKLAVATLN